MSRLTYSLIIFLFSNILASQYYENISCLQSEIDVIKYHLKIDLNFDKKNIRCSNEINLIKSPLSKDTLTLDFYNNLVIENILANDMKLNYKREERKIFIDISSQINDTLTLRIEYYGKPKTFGLEGLVFASINEQKIIQTINQPNYAPTWFPCNDDPSDKSVLEMEITNDSEFISVANGFLFNRFENNGRTTFHYKTIYPIATNLIGFYSSNYSVIKEVYTTINGNKLNMEYFIFPKDSLKAIYDLADMKNYINTFENIFGEYPFVEEKFCISEILYGRGAIENQTLIGIGRDLFSGKQFHKDVFIHELAHSWWGNAVGISDWKDIWLSEGFATYSEALFFEYHYGKSALNSYMSKFITEQLSGRLYNPENLFGENVYYKGAWVLHMIRNIISDTIFFDFLKNFYNHFRYKSISTMEFKELLESFSGIDFTKFFNQWIYQDNGIIDCSYFYIQNEKIISIKQNDFIFEFPLEIKIVYENSSFEILNTFIDREEVIIDLPLKENIKEIILDPEMKLLARFNKYN